MNKLEFKEVLNAFGINNHLMDTNGRYGSKEEIHFWNNIALYFGGSFYTVVMGKIPLEVANIIYEKYPDNQHNIRVDGGESDYVPNEHAVDSQYEQELQENAKQNLAAEIFLKRCQRAQEQMQKRSDEGKYIKKYHIDSKEGLVIFLSELNDYYARKQGLPEINVQRYDEIIASVNAGILKKVNPCITTYDWMCADKQYGKEFFYNVSRSRQTPLGKDFRELIEQFDKTVNPYMDDSIELDSLDSYLQKINIEANAYDEVDGMYRENCCNIVIRPKDSDSEVEFRRKPNGFFSQLTYVFGPGDYMLVLHYCANYDEYISINYFGANSQRKIKLKYNVHQINRGQFGELSKEESDQMSFVYEELAKAVQLASTITIDKMQKPDIQRG